MAAICAFIAPFCMLVPGELGVLGATLFTLVAWASATQTSIEPAIILVFVLFGFGAANAHPYLQWAVCLGVPFGVTVLISLCEGRIRPRAWFRLLCVALARLFATPGTRGTIHARWFAFGFWLVFLIIAVQTEHAQAHYLQAWLVAFLMMWALRWSVPRWEPARLARLSLAFSAQPLLYTFTSHPSMIRSSSLTYVSIACMSLAALWLIAECWRDWRILAGRHPRWTLAERKRDRHLIRERVVQTSYRDSTQGSVVGSLPQRSSFGTEVCVFLILTVAFQFFKHLLC